MKRLLILLISSLLLLGCDQKEQAPKQGMDVQGFLVKRGLQPAQHGQKAPDFTIELLEKDPLKVKKALSQEAPVRLNPHQKHEVLGKTLKLSDLKGKVVFLNFWATWCPPCKREMPDMEELYYKFQDRDFVMIAVSLGEPRARVEHFIEDFPYSFDIAIDPENEIGALYGVQSLPVTYVIGKNGVIVAKALGIRPWTNPEFYQFIETLLP